MVFHPGEIGASLDILSEHQELRIIRHERETALLRFLSLRPESEMGAEPPEKKPSPGIIRLLRHGAVGRLLCLLDFPEIVERRSEPIPISARARCILLSTPENLHGPDVLFVAVHVVERIGKPERRLEILRGLFLREPAFGNALRNFLVDQMLHAPGIHGSAVVKGIKLLSIRVGEDSPFRGCHDFLLPLRFLGLFCSGR